MKKNFTFALVLVSEIMQITAHDWNVTHSDKGFIAA